MKNRPLTREIRRKIDASIKRATRFGPVFLSLRQALKHGPITIGRYCDDHREMYARIDSLPVGGSVMLDVADPQRAMNAIHARASRDHRARQFSTRICELSSLLVERKPRKPRSKR